MLGYQGHRKQRSGKKGRGQVVFKFILTPGGGGGSAEAQEERGESYSRPENQYTSSLSYHFWFCLLDLLLMGKVSPTHGNAPFMVNHIGCWYIGQ